MSDTTRRSPSLRSPRVLVTGALGLAVAALVVGRRRALDRAEARFHRRYDRSG